MTGSQSETTTDREIVISRVIEGPRRLVFEACSNSFHLNRWWGPDGFSITTSAFEFSVGGEWVFVMHGPDGTDYQNWVQFLEIAPPEHIALRHGVGPDDPEAFDSTITFDEVAEGTRVTLRSVFPTKELRDRAAEQYDAIEGGKQTLGRLAGYVTNQQEDPGERSR